MSPTNLKSKSERSGGLDVLRFLAVLVVFFAHYTDTFNVSYQIVPENLKWAPIFRYGRVALLVLFMISGYVITMTSMGRNLKDFMIARLSRIYPLFWVSCIAAFILPRLVGHSYLEYSSFKVFLANLTMIAPVVGAPLINPIFYTLVVQFFFYLFIALIIIFKAWKWILPIIGLLLIYTAFHALDRDMGIQNFFPSYAAGMLIYFIRNENFSKWILYALLVMTLFITLITGKIIALDMQDLFRDQIPFHFEVFCVAVIGMYVVLFMLTAKKQIVGNSKFTRALAELSYPFYLFHFYFLVFYWYLSDKVQPDLLLFGLLLIILMISWLLNILVEKPVSRLLIYLLNAIANLFSKNVTANNIK